MKITIAFLAVLISLGSAKDNAQGLRNPSPPQGKKPSLRVPLNVGRQFHPSPFSPQGRPVRVPQITIPELPAAPLNLVPNAPILSGLPVPSIPSVPLPPLPALPISIASAGVDVNGSGVSINVPSIPGIPLPSPVSVPLPSLPIPQVPAGVDVNGSGVSINVPSISGLPVPVPNSIPVSLPASLIPSLPVPSVPSIPLPAVPIPSLPSIPPVSIPSLPLPVPIPPLSVPSLPIAAQKASESEKLRTYHLLKLNTREKRTAMPENWRVVPDTQQDDSISKTPMKKPTRNPGVQIKPTTNAQTGGKPSSRSVRGRGTGVPSGRTGGSSRKPSRFNNQRP